MDTLKSHFERKSLLIVERLSFNHCNQRADETVMEYAASCEFGETLDEALCDRFMSVIHVTQCQPEDTHGEFQPSNRNELLPKSPPFHAKGRRSTDPITNALVQRYGRLREWLWTPSWLHS